MLIAPSPTFRSLMTVLTLTALARPCLGLEWRDAFAVRDDADMVASVGLGFSSLLSLDRLPDDAHGLGGRLTGGLRYADDDKVALFEVANIDYHTIYRPERDRYEGGSMPTVALFSLSSQLRLTQRFHLLYGAALSRSGTFTHSSSGGLAFHLGTAIPLLSRSSETMRDYRRAYLQVEFIPLAGSLLSTLNEEGFYDSEHPTPQVQGEVALAGRVETFLGSVSAEARLSASYVHQRSMYMRLLLQWVGPTFWRRVAITIRSRLIVPLRPLRRHLSENAQLILYEPNVALSFGVLVYLDQVPSVAPEHAARRAQYRDRRRERQTLRSQRRARRERDRSTRRRPQ